VNTRYRVLSKKVGDRWTYRYEHRALAERVVGHPLPTTVHIHHRDDNRRNNAPANLVICESASYHGLLHYRTRAYRATGDVHSLKCVFCKTWGLAPDLNGSHKWAYHRRCATDYGSVRRRRAARH
jgi:hypothetical protein